MTEFAVAVGPPGRQVVFVKKVAAAVRFAPGEVVRSAVLGDLKVLACDWTADRDGFMVTFADVIAPDGTAETIAGAMRKNGWSRV